MGTKADLRASLPEDLALPDRYQLLRRIATGGMASVWCAEDRVLGRRVAIKLLSDAYAHDGMAVRRFKREARVAARLSAHRNIVTIFDVDQAARTSDPGGPHRAFIVMEYLAGGTVADALRVGAVPREQAIRWVSETAAALDYAHGQGVVHRDIKPVNLLLDCDRVVHVADFGIARIGTDDSITNTGLVLGTAAYISPEQALGRPATEASDRYALAVTAFELLAGERPFAANQMAAQARQHVEDEPPSASLRNPELPSAVDAVLARGMAKQPEDRWPTAGAFATALGDALTEAPATARQGILAAGLAAAARAAAAPRAAAAARVSGAPLRYRRRVPAAPAETPPAIFASSRRRSPGRSLALAALAAALFAVVLIATGRPGGSAPARKTAETRHTAPTRPAAPPPVLARPKLPPRPAATAATATTATTSEVTATAAAATPPAPTADTLEAQGHSLMEGGSYTAAIPVLRQALADAPKGSLTYAYALYDLGRALRLAGDPRAAVPLLWQRMHIPNQTGTVRVELQAALQALGRAAQSSSGGPPGKAKDHGKPTGDGHD